MLVIATAATTGAREGETSPHHADGDVLGGQISTFLDASIEFSRDKARRICEPRTDVVSLGRSTDQIDGSYRYRVLANFSGPELTHLRQVSGFADLSLQQPREGATLAAYVGDRTCSPISRAEFTSDNGTIHAWYLFRYDSQDTAIEETGAQWRARFVPTFPRCL